MTNFNYDNYDDDTKAKYDDGIEFLDDIDDDLDVEDMLEYEGDFHESYPDDYF